MLVALILTLVQASAPEVGPSGPARARPRAVLVGCEEYPELRKALGEERYARDIRLAGPVNDVGLVQATLARVLGLAPADTTVLAGWGVDPVKRPTRANILAALERLAREIEPGALAIVYLAGHGSQQRVQRQKEDEPDGLDEVFLPADAALAKEGWIPNAIRDDELGARLRAIRDAGADVWLIVDACHSGTLLRSAPAESGVRLRHIDRAALGIEESRTERAARRPEAPSGWIGSGEPRIAALYAAQSYGRAPEMPIPRGGTVVRGLFTYLLCQELERSHGRLSYRELCARVVSAYQAFPCSLTIPSAEGDLAREVASGAVAGGPPLVVFVRDGKPWVDQGRLAGIEPGVRMVASHVADGAHQPVAQVEVVESDVLSARCRVVDGELPGEGPFAAEIYERPGRDWSLAIALVRPDGTSLDAHALPERVRAALEEERGRFPLVAPSAADWWVVVAREGRVWLRPGPQEGGYELLDVEWETLAHRLRSLQTTRNLRRSASEIASRCEADLDLWIERKDGRGRVRRMEAPIELHPSDEIRVRLAKRSARILDVNVFYLDANHRRHLLLTRRLEAVANATLALTDWLTVTDDALGLEQLLVLATPRPPAAPHVDLGWLADDSPLRGATGGPLADLLHGLSSGSDLRGEALAVSPELEETCSILLPLRTHWRELRAPDWPRGEALELAPIGVADRDADAPQDPLGCGSRARLVRSAGSEMLDTLLVGDGRVRAVLLDLDRDSGLDGLDRMALVAAIAARRFDAETAFLFAEDGRFAFYESSGTGRLDRVAVDRDADGNAEELLLFEDGAWHAFSGMAVPWLSQQHLTRKPGVSSRELAARFGVLQSDP